MDHEQQQLLIDRYPELLDIEPSPWGPGMGFTIRVGAVGWFQILDTLFQQMMEITRSQNSSGFACRITYIKEKMGELRITCECEDGRIIDLVRQARVESALPAKCVEDMGLCTYYLEVSRRRCVK